MSCSVKYSSTKTLKLLKAGTSISLGYVSLYFYPHFFETLPAFRPSLVSIFITL